MCRCSLWAAPSGPAGPPVDAELPGPRGNGGAAVTTRSGPAGARGIVLLSLTLVLAVGAAACGGAAGPGLPGATSDPQSPGATSSAAPDTSPGTSLAGTGPGSPAPSPGASGPAPSDADPFGGQDDAGDVVIPDVGPLPDPDEGGVPPYERTTPATGSLATGPTTEFGTATIGAAGGTIIAEGLRIEVPAGALTSDTTFEITSAPVTVTGFGGIVSPVTLLYDIEVGGADLATPVTVTLPASVPAGQTAMAFSYDADAGTLTPLIPLGSDATSITAGATHFSSLLGAAVDAAKIPPIVDSGFRPGVDDWQFANHGSYAAPGGHCEGQSVGEIWYYVIQRLGAGANPLHGTYDNNGAPDKTPALWQDDSDGYRFASAVQRSEIADAVTYSSMRNAMWNAADGRPIYEAFRVAVAMRGEPQLIHIFTGPDDRGHAMVVYRVTPDWLLVADPNYPGIGRRIRYDSDTGRFGPFVSGNSAADIAAGNSRTYTRFGYVPWESATSKATLSSLWGDFEGGWAGDNVFPTYSLFVTTEKDAAGKDVWVPLTDGFALPASTETVTIQVSKLAGGAASTMRVYAGTSTVPLGGWGWKQILPLEPGANLFGIEIWGRTADKWKYVDFVRLTIERGEAPTPTPEANERLTLTITAEVPTDTEGIGTCPAEVYLVFSRRGGDPSTFQGRASLSAICTNREFQAIDTNGGTFDGSTFTLPDGQWTYTGTLSGNTVVITGGPPGSGTLEFTLP